MFASPILLAEEEPNQPISINLVDADIGFVLRMLMEASKANIVFQGSITGPVTCQITDKPLEQILDVLTKSNSLYWHKENGVYIVTKQPVSASVPAAPAAADPAPAVAPSGQLDLDRQGVALAPRAPVRYEKIPVRYVHPDTVVYMLGQSASPGIDMMGALVPVGQLPGMNILPQAAWNSTGGLGSNPGGGSLQERMANVGIGAPAFPGRTVSPGSGYPGQYPGAVGGGFSGAVGGGGYGGGYGAGGIGGGIGGAGGAGGQSSVMGGGLIDLLPPGIDRIIAYPIDNSILVLGTDEAIAALRQLITMLDVPQKQVRIECEFLTVSSGDADKFGFTWLVSDGINEVTADLPSSGNLNVRFAKGNFAAQIQAFKSSHRGRTIISPRLTTMNNLPASVMVNHTGVFFTPGTPGGGPFGAPPQPPTPVQYQVPISLSVVPRISGDGQWVTMTLSPQVSDIVGTVSSGGTTLPIVDTQAVQIPSIRVLDGQTLVLGGMVRRSETTTNDKLPFFSDLPLIGHLFRNNDHSADDAELLIFVTPHVLQDEQAVESMSATTVQPLPATP